jgi:hypothetical protein
MRRSHVATALVALSIGLTASSAMRRLVNRRRSVTAAVATGHARPAPEHDAVVVPFTRRPVPAAAPAEPSAPARCGDTGGRTKAGAPCGARATSGGRCHHHPMAA